MSGAGLASLKRFTASLRALPRAVAQKVTTAVAPAITALALETFDAGEDAYGVDWTPGAEGQRVTLHRTGALEAQIHYVAIGTRLRVALGVPYAKYQLGKRPAFPHQGDPLPQAYAETLARTSAEVIARELGGGS